MTNQVERKQGLITATERAGGLGHLANALGYSYSAIATAKSPSTKINDRLWSFIREYLEKGEVAEKPLDMEDGVIYEVIYNEADDEWDVVHRPGDKCVHSDWSEARALEWAARNNPHDPDRRRA